jgi:hypothetical protein
MRRLEFLLQGGKRKGNCLSAASFPFPSLRHKFKESVAASGAPFFAYFLWQDKESESAPAGDETRDAPPRPSQEKKLKPP